MITIRKAVADDKDKIREIINSESLTKIDSDALPEHTMVIEVEGALVGFGFLEIAADLALIKFVFIKPDYRNQGLGDGLVRSLINYADRRGVKYIYVFSNNKMDYFKRFGFSYITSHECDEKVIEIFNVNIGQQPFIMELDVERFFDSCCCH